MFLQNLLQKITDALKNFGPSVATIKDFKFDRENLEFFIFNNFREIIISIVALFSLLTILIVVILLILNTISPSRAEAPVLENTEAAITAPPKPRKNKFEDVDSLVGQTVIYPDLASFSISNEYIDFMALKKLNTPDLKIIMNEFDELIELSLDEACLFNFEKRSRFERNNQK